MYTKDRNFVQGKHLWKMELIVGLCASLEGIWRKCLCDRGILTKSCVA